MADIPPDENEEYLVKEVIRRTKNDLEERIHFHPIMGKMFSEGVISMRQHDELKTRKDSTGEISAITNFMDMVLRNDVKTSGFMKTLKEQMPLIYAEIVDGINKFKTGKWTLPDLKGNCHAEISI